MAPRRHRAATRFARRRGRAAERAIATIEMAILTPVMLLLVTFSTQAALWQEADHVALAAAESGVAAGTQVGGSPAGAKGQALSAASQMGSGVLISPGATVTEAAGLVTVTYKAGQMTSVRIFDGKTGAMIREIPVVNE